jgi:glycopeptide antibiotics resistance protein
MKIAPDKWKHFYVGVILGVLFQIIFWWIMPSHPFWDCVATLFVVIAISYGFELFSLITAIGYYELMDAVAGTIGGIIGIIPVLLFQLRVL